MGPMRLRVALITLGLTLLVPPPAVAIMWGLRWVGGEAATFAVLARYTVVVALVLAPVFLAPLVWLAFRLRDASHRLRDAAYTDALTGAPNRRAFFGHVAGRLGRAGAPRLFSVLMIDVDRFKALNDRLGHEGGDAALIYVARELARGLAKAGVEGAFLSRLGGEEFAVFLDGAPLPVAARAAEAICAHMRGMAFGHRGGRHVITVSVGVWSGTAQGGADAALALADRAAYAAKANGRDRWEVAGRDATAAAA